jgi:non-specific serine/threonine protein kinase/serine/threonine-protein kinase
MSRDDWERVKRVAGEAWALPASERVRYATAACGDDDNLCREVLSLLTSMEDAGDSFETPALAMPEGRRAMAGMIAADRPLLEGSLVDNWRILRPLGHGGMGTVYLAERATAEFRQHAAIKLVRGGVADDVLLRRFHDERRILAALDHPNIAHLIDGGATELGLPFVVMEYVEGLPIDSYCAERRLTIRQILEVFRVVCLAVHYAHQRLVVHRDLKASNILVTPHGVPKLLDFGIAKMLLPDGPLDATRTLFRIVTPESASPEQLRGEPISTSTDIYALGVLLYRLLCGKSPYRAAGDSEAELIKAICEQPVDPPSQARREGAKENLGVFEPIDRDLDRIVLMALRKEPERRYGTAAQFADDVSRYLGGHPIVAAPDSRAYRARKFAERHRAAVAAGAGFLLALTAGIAATTWQANVARAERNRAQHQFNAVRTLANSVLGELNDAVRKLPGSLAARELLLRRTTEYLDALSREAAGDVGLRRELALNYKRLAQVQGESGNSNLGDEAAARKAYEKAAALFESLPEPLDTDAAVALCGTYLNLAEIIADPEVARGYQDKAKTLVERLLHSAPSDPKVLSAATVFWYRTGAAQESAKDYAAALQSFKNASQAAERHLALQPANGDASRNLSIVYRKAGSQNEMLDRLDEAIPLYRKALEIDERAVQREPAINEWRLNLSFSHAALGSALRAKGQLPEAAEQYRRAIALRKSVTETEPNDDFALSALARGYERYALVLRQAGDAPGVMRAELDRLEIYERRRQRHPERANVWDDEMAALADATNDLLDTLEPWRGANRAALLQRSCALLDRISVLRAEWIRDKRPGSLSPVKPDVDQLRLRCEKLIGR